MSPGPAPWRLAHAAAGAAVRLSHGRNFTVLAGHTRLLALARAADTGGHGGSGSTSSTNEPRQRRPPPPTPFPTVATCPAPTCACAPMPDIPAGLPIDHTAPLNGMIPGYQEQVVVCTGESDWPSRIEDAHSGDNLAADLKELFGRGGKYSDPYHHVAVVNASFPPSVPSRGAPGLQTTSAYLLPSFRYVPFLPRVSFDSVDALAKGYLLPARLHPAHDGQLSPVHRDRLTRHAAYQRLLWGVRNSVDDVLVLICGHGGRDARCGLVGPVLQTAFEAALERAGVSVLRGPVIVAAPEEAEEEEKQKRLLSGAPGSDPAPSGDAHQPGGGTTTGGALRAPLTTARVGLISHIGGHKFAGNVIVYLPPTLRRADGGGPHPLAGYGVWYGRVEPQHAEGLVQETILRGRVVVDHFRGAINRNRDIIRL
ncbi:sucrose cleavage family protein [Niveomyces insectorum RCEF 264]|uniref:Altered inheritance of mitochondria protein 32 n=1 Tax=Niveomyces insectorum RCEF 264 TaxID=1081102 RepID=A0A162LCS9_9HYPO|nr:sucrose cleavage family protein [Niveomyces insectorum RCEF 264]